MSNGTGTFDLMMQALVRSAAGSYMGHRGIEAFADGSQISGWSGIGFAMLCFVGAVVTLWQMRPWAPTTKNQE